MQRKAAQESSQAADPELKASPIVIQAPQKESTTQKKKRIHPIKLRKLKTDQDAPDGSATDSGSSDVLSTERGEASYYAEFFNGRTTASGTIFSNDDMTAAHRTMKFGSRVRVTNMDNGKSIEVEITDRGPYAKGRIIDLTREGFSRLDNISRGVMPVKVETLFVP